jgi:hypothetical protein
VIPADQPYLTDAEIYALKTASTTKSIAVRDGLWRVSDLEERALMREVMTTQFERLTELGLLEHADIIHQGLAGSGDDYTEKRWAITDAGRMWIAREQELRVVATAPVNARPTQGEREVPAIAAATLYFWSDGLVTWTLIRPEL